MWVRVSLSVSVEKSGEHIRIYCTYDFPSIYIYIYIFFRCHVQIRVFVPLHFCTCVLRPGLDRHRAGLAHANAVLGQHPELVLHPGVEVHHSGRERVAIDDLWNWEKRTKK